VKLAPLKWPSAVGLLQLPFAGCWQVEVVGSIEESGRSKDGSIVRLVLGNDLLSQRDGFVELRVLLSLAPPLKDEHNLAQELTRLT
jgi:hypothetical protein